MRAEDVADTIELTPAASECDQAVARHQPCLLSDKGPCYTSGDGSVALTAAVQNLSNYGAFQAAT